MAKFELSRLSNAAATDTLGFEQLISTQTEIVAGVIETKYYELLGQNLSDFVSFDVGRGAYSTNVFQYTSAYVGSPFEDGLVQPSSGLGINAKSSIQIDGISLKNNFWRMDYEVSHEIIEMGKVNAQAFSLIEENEKARKKVYDLGIQKIVFEGIKGDGDVLGLLNQPTVTINTSLAAKSLKNMSATEFSAFAVGSLGAYLTNNNNTAMPDTLMLATSDFVALGAPSNDSYPLKTKRDILEEAFRKAGAVNLKIVHSKYNETASTSSGIRMVLYHNVPDSVKVYIPKQYTPNALYPMNGVDFVSVAEAQFTGVQCIRPKEMLYIDVTA